MSDRSSELCLMCNNTGSLRCARCKSAHYCTKKCQEGDWPTHKLLCANFATFDISTRPTNDHFRAIFFNDKYSKPQIIWLQYEKINENKMKFHNPEFRAFQGPENVLGNSQIRYDASLGRKVSGTILINQCGFNLNESSPEDLFRSNKSIGKITATKPGEYHEWHGQLVAHGMSGLGTRHNDGRDLDMKDFRHITNFFLAYNGEQSSKVNFTFGGVIIGTRINCSGDQNKFGKPLFEAVEVDSADPIFSKHTTSDIAQRIGIPLFTRRYPSDPTWKDKKDDPTLGPFPLLNAEAEMLHLCCDPKAFSNHQADCPAFGMAHEEWRSDTGSVLVVRQDRKPFSPIHVEALCHYCHHEARPILAHARGDCYPEGPLNVEDALAFICRPMFVVTWHKLLERRMTEPQRLGPFPHPYYDTPVSEYMFPMSFDGDKGPLTVLKMMTSGQSSHSQV